MQNGEPEVPDEALAEAWEAEGEDIREEVRAVGPALVLGLIPVGLVAMLLMALLGEKAWLLFPLGFAAIWLAPWLIAAWRRHQSPLALPLSDGRMLEGAAKRRAVRIAAIGIPALAALALLGDHWIGRGLSALREALQGLSDAWPW